MGTTNVEHGDARRVVPEDDAIARAIASVPGVAEAGIVRPPGGGRSRLTLRLHPGEDDQRVAWAVAATLRERFDIDLDPDAIRPRMTATSSPERDPVAVVRTRDVEGTDGATGASDEDGSPSAHATGAASRPDDGPSSSSARGQVPWPPRDRPWTAREPIDPAAGASPGAAATSGAAPTATGVPLEPTAAPRLGQATAQGQPIEQLTTTRERLSRAVEDALAGLVAGPADDAGAELADEPGVADPDEAAAATPPGEPAAVGATPPGEPDAVGATSSAAPGPGTVDAPAPNAGTVDAPAPPAAAIHAAMLRPPRAVIERLEVRRGHDTVEVTVTLRHESHTAAGTATAVSTSKGRMRATAEATVAAVHALVQASLVVGVDRIVLTDGGDDVTVSVVLTMVTAGDEQRLLGGAIVRDDTDAEGAVVRATLDALNRRVVPLLVNR